MDEKTGNRFELSQDGRNRLSEGKTQEAYEIFFALWNQKERSQWDGYYLALCLNRLGKLDQTLTLCRQVMETYPEFRQIIGVFLFAMYKLNIEPQKNNPLPDFMLLEQSVQEVLAVSKTVPGEFFRLKALLCISSIYIKTGQPQKALPFIDKIEAANLSKERFKFTSSKSKDVYLQSDFEKYFGFKAKVYEQLEQWEECENACREAIEQGVDDIWIQRRMALAVYNLGREEEGLDKLLRIANTRKNWYIYLDVAELCGKAENYSDAIQYASKAFISGNHNGHRDLIVKGLMLSAGWCEKLHDLESARLHAEYLAHLCAVKNWEISGEIKDTLETFDIPERKSDNIISLSQKLNSFWAAKAGFSEGFLYGKVINVIHEKKYGFIKGDDGIDYFFLYSEYKGNRKELKKGVKVKFFGKRGYNHVKKRELVEAVKIREYNSNNSSA